MFKFLLILISLTSLFLPMSAYARCAVCYTNGLSGASIAVIVIFLSAIFLFLVNKLLHKFFDKGNV